MANFNLYLSSFALLLTLNWNTSMGTPVRLPLTPSANNCTQLQTLSKTLLNNLQELVKDNHRIFGLPCSSQPIEMNSKTQTVQTCTPNMESRCSAYRNSGFNETDCLGNIQEDLKHYRTALQSYIETQDHPSESLKTMLTTTLTTTEKLLKTCFPMSTTKMDSQEVVAHMWNQSSFNNRSRLCKVMKGFHARMITINRALCYISSGDHNK